jgi:oxygen-dependent protoporphyrinogen oxidase
MAPRFVIVGAGVSGLTLAWRLHRARPDARITVLEASGRPGGCVWTDRHPSGFVVENGPNGFLDNKPSTMALVRDLGLAGRLVPASESSGRKRYVFLNGRLHALPSSLLGFLRDPLLSWRGKLALLGEPLWRRNTPRHGDESVAAFAHRRAGREAAEVFADALVTGIHGGDPELLDVRAAFPRLYELERRYGSVVRGLMTTRRQKRAEARARGEPPPAPQRLWSFAGGLREMTDTLAAQLPEPPEYGVAVRGLERGADGRGWRVLADGRSWDADAVALACPAWASAGILRGLDPGLADLFGGIAYNRIAVVALGYAAGDVRGDFDGFGYIAPQRTRRDLLGVQWCSAIYPDRAPAGMVLWRALVGGWHRAEQVDWPDGRLIAAVRAELRLATGVTADPTFTQVVRWDRAIPQYLLGHPRRVAEIEEVAARHPGLHLAGNALHGVALNDCTETAARVASAMTSGVG